MESVLVGVIKRGEKSKVRRVGIFAAVKDQDEIVRIGWSLCKAKVGDKFNYQDGVTIALKRASKAQCINAMPLSLAKKLDRFIDRAKRYFKTDKIVVSSEVPKQLAQ